MFNSTLKSSVIYSFRRTIIAFIIISMLIIACIPAFAEGGGSTCKFEPTGTAERDGVKVIFEAKDAAFNYIGQASSGAGGNYEENAAAANEWLAETFG